MQAAKRKNPSTQTALSASGIDIILRLLEIDPEKRPNAKEAFNHHWFINFTKQQTHNLKLQKFKEANGMVSLRTIIECSEISEKEIESRKSFIFGKKSLLSSFQENMLHPQTSIQANLLNTGVVVQGGGSNMNNFAENRNANKDEVKNCDEEDFYISDEDNQVMNLMKKLNNLSDTKLPSKVSRVNKKRLSTAS